MASALQSFGHFGDLASATARFQSVPADVVFALDTADYRPPVAQDRIYVGRSLPFGPRSTIDASFTRSLLANGELSEIAAASYSRTLPYDASVFATLFHDFGTTKTTGVFFGLSVPLGDAVSVSSGYSGGSGGGALSSTANKTLDLANGSYGFSVRDGEGESPYRAATGAYRLPFGVIQAGVDQGGAGAHSAYGGQAEFRGSMATMGGGVFFSNWIDDGFAVVSTGAPGVQVLSDNRPIGVTDSRGMLLAPTLRSYQINSLSIDPANLPLDAEIESARMVAVVKDKGGALIDFKVKRDDASAIVIFSLPGGGFVGAGSVGHAGGEEFVVGYDGEAFLKRLSPANQATIELAEESVTLHSISARSPTSSSASGR